VVVFSGVAVANSVEKRGYGKEIEKKEIKQEIVRAYCWLLAANYLDRYDLKTRNVMLLIIILYTIII
jgi:hypothetical protein